MEEIFLNIHDLLKDQEIKFARVGITNTVHNYSFLNISDISTIDEKKKRTIFFQNIKILQLIFFEQKKKLNSKTKKYLIIRFKIIDNIKDKNCIIKEYIKRQINIDNIDKMNLTVDEKLKIIFEPQAQYVLGFIHIKGQYVAYNIDKVIHYYSKAQFKYQVIYQESNYIIHYNIKPNSYKGYRAKRDSFKEMLKDSPDGTYDFETGDPIDFSGQKKYQVSFQTTASEDVTSGNYLINDEYDALVEEFSRQTGSKPYLGKFEVPETSFCCKSLKKAMRLAKKFNQMSIWSWETMEEIPNPDFDPTQNLVKAGKKDEIKVTQSIETILKKTELKFKYIENNFFN